MDSLPGVVFESAVCDYCGSTDARRLFTGPDRLLALPGSFTVVVCEKCGLLRQDPRPTPETIGAYYPASYDPYSRAIDDEPSFLARASRRYGMRRRRQAIERMVPQGILLDVGCATGNFLNEMRRTGRWQVAGVEPSEGAGQYARKRFGLLIHPSTLTEVGLPPASHDVITMWNVLEHLHSPMENLARVAELLRPGGLFVFSIPNLSSLEARFFGRYWMGWELPRHLYYPSLPMATQMLDQVDLEIVGWDCLVGAYQSYLLTLRFWLAAVGRDAWWASTALGLLGSMPMQLASFPLFKLITLMNRASLITGFARRRAT